MGDFIPTSFRNLGPWLTNLKERIIADGPTCGQSPAQVTSDTGLVDTLLTPVSDALTKETAWLEASGTARTVMRDTNTPIRAMLNRYRAATGFTQGMENAWQISSHETEYDMSTHTPTIIAKARPGMVEIGGKKPGFTALDIQARVDGTEAWETIGVKVNHLPFIDSRPSANGKPEKRESRGLGYNGDQQVGQPSPIVTGIWGV